jgi:HD-GYP domain-containing protein (c-di-GMP phosphodiesterase class II)
MLSARPYRSSFDADEVTAELQRQSGAQFDPTLVNAIIRILQNRSPHAPEALACVGERQRT